MRNLRLWAFAIAVLTLPSCGTVGTPRPVAAAPSTSGIRQVDDAGVRLPFETTLSKRWSRANSGTTYEPCTALSGAALEALGIDPATVADAAKTNGQTLRGCEWDYAENSDAARWNISQFVGNSVSLEHDKQIRTGGMDRWLPDTTVDGRTVGIHIYTTGDQCDTYVQSGKAAVNTMVIRFGTRDVPISQICDRALAFTRATIDKMPR